MSTTLWYLLPWIPSHSKHVPLKISCCWSIPSRAAHAGHPLRRGKPFRSSSIVETPRAHCPRYAIASQHVRSSVGWAFAVFPAKVRAMCSVLLLKGQTLRRAGITQHRRTNDSRGAVSKINQDHLSHELLRRSFAKLQRFDKQILLTCVSIIFH